jgi:hypothetical protein
MSPRGMLEHRTDRELAHDGTNARKKDVGAPRDFCRSWKNRTEVTVPGSHFIQEDSGPAIGRAVAGWMKANALQDDRITAALPDRAIVFKLSV